MKNISKLKNHFVICGYGRMGAVIARELQEKDLDFVIIEVNDKKGENCNETLVSLNVLIDPIRSSPGR